ncbi:hypothetical protein KTQ42_20215 [Noviherbaspirillum sp. L7-7A]|uniref:hypothetical protein n=1 Tax=Noviherbaspirillum sp. L7-7A TaxID=2850560 RepID=UPI001C2C909F|nr:hypothetical protein [Noviherbaspirillum sp. L7-7A]MBV0881609.1 hypothetical protein [Noviherbaspirillum sp. L7-7A]
MAKFLRQYDPSETKRRVTIEISEENCPGMLEALSVLPYGHETPLIRAVFYQWLLDRQAEGLQDEAMLAALAGPGGRPDGRRPNKMAMGSNLPTRRPVNKATKPTRSLVHLAQEPSRNDPAHMQNTVLVSSISSPAASSLSTHPVAPGPIPAPAPTLVSVEPAQTSGPSGSALPTPNSDQTAPVDVNTLTAGQLEGLFELETMFD